jgi:dipeptidase E
MPSERHILRSGKNKDPNNLDDMKLLLLSNSTNPGEDYLGWPEPFIRDFILKHAIRKILFIPYAGVNLSPDGLERSYDLYEERVKGVFSNFNVELSSIHREHDPVEAVRGAAAIAVGGGNTFHLVKRMHETGIMKEIRDAVMKGIPYMGWSAGSNVACPTMMTTNDMPICEPPSFSCLGLIRFQINPHYLDANPAGHGGETREQRISEYLVLNRNVVVAGLRESTLLECEGEAIFLKGTRPMRVFRYDTAPAEIQPGADVSRILNPVS